MVKWRNDFLNPISHQNFANALTETPNLNLEVCHIVVGRGLKWSKLTQFHKGGPCRKDKLLTKKGA